MGKMVDAQSITIATAATEQVGNEGIIFRFVAWHSVALCSIVGIIVLAQTPTMVEISGILLVAIGVGVHKPAA